MPSHSMDTPRISLTTAFAFSSNDHLLATSNDQQYIFLYNAIATGVAQKWGAHTITWALAFSHDSKFLASGGNSGRIYIWNALDHDFGVRREPMSRLYGHTEPVRCIAWSPRGDLIASSSDDYTVLTWTITHQGDEVTFESLFQYDCHWGAVMFVRFSPYGYWLASGGADSQCRLFHVRPNATPRADGTPRTLKLHKKLVGHMGTVRAADFNPNNTKIATASDDGSVRIWNTETGELLQRLYGEPSCPVLQVCFSPLQGNLLGARSGSLVQLCRVFSGGVRVCTVQDFDSVMNCTAPDPENDVVMIASADNTVVRWGLKDGSTAIIDGRTNNLRQVILMPNDMALLWRRFEPVGIIQWSNRFNELE